MSEIQMHDVMNAEVKVDVYDGPNCDQHRKEFYIYCDGDKDGDTSVDDIVIKLAELPAGAKVCISYPICPDCGTPRMDDMKCEDGAYKIIGHDDKCDCGFDWINWAEEQYS